MFKIESYITPIILNYLEKYVKNIRPQDFQVSLWEGEVSFQNLDLRLDALEQELNLPFEFLSGHVHELGIQIPWTKITSEPIRVMINTIEFVLKAKSKDSGHKSSGSNSPQHTHTLDEAAAALSNERREDDTSSMASGLAMRIVHNINVQCQNIILKYVEEDIVVSMNVQCLDYGPANDMWQPAMIDINPHKVLMRKIINISDLTICLDKRNSSGQIDVCMEPVLYRCTMEIRFLRKYNSNTLAVRSTSRIGVFSQVIDLNLSTLQIPMLMRLIKILTSLIAENKSEPPGQSLTNRESTRNSSDSTRRPEPDQSYLSWAWNLLPSFNLDEFDEVDSNSDAARGHIKDIGIYVEELNLTLKQSDFINDAMMGGIKRIRYMPIVRFGFGGLYFENVSVAEIDWCSTKAGLSSLYVEPLGTYRSDEPQETMALLETAPFTNMRSYIDKSLFDEECKIADRGWGVTNYEDYVARMTDDYLLYRSPTFAFDIITYRSNHSGGSNDVQTPSECLKISNMQRQCRVLSAGITLRFNRNFVQVKTILYSFIEFFDSTAYSSNVEKIDTYDSSTATTTTTTKTKSMIQQDSQGVPIESSPNLSKQSASGKNASANPEGSPKLHPPLVEDYDALMSGIPLTKYKIELKRIRIEMYAKTDPEAGSCHIQKRLAPASVQNSNPFLQLYFDHVEGSLSTPLCPDKLVHTTCQLPDKPAELLNACYDNYELNMKDFSVGLMARTNDSYFKLITVPKLQMCYGSLLQSHHWKTDEVPIKKLDIQCDHIKMEASKRELYASLYLYSAIWCFQPKSNVKVMDILNYPLQLSDSISFNCMLSKLTIKRRYYHTFDIWNATLCSFTSDVIVDRKSATQAQRYNVLTSTSKMHNNQNKWLEIQVQYPVSVEINQSSMKKDAKDQLYMTIGVWVERFNIVIDQNLLNFLAFTCEANSKRTKDYSFDVEGLNATLKNIPPPPPPPPTTSHHTSSAPSTSLACQTIPSLPQVFGRKLVRNSNTGRKMSQPEETIHYSSEKDERPEYVTTEQLNVNLMEKEKVEDIKPDEEKIKSFLKLFNRIIIYVDVAQSQIDLSPKCLEKHVNVNEFLNKYEMHTRICMPRIMWKSTYAEYITRSSLRLKVNPPPLTTKTSFNWTIQFKDLSIGINSNGSCYPVLSPWQTTLTVAMAKKKQSVTTNAEISQHLQREAARESFTPLSPKAKVKPKYTSEYEVTSVSSESFVPSEQIKESPTPSTSSHAENKNKTKENNDNPMATTTANVSDKVQEIVCLNLHLDSSTVHFFGDNVKVLRTDMQHLLYVLELSLSLTKPKCNNSRTKMTEPIMILTSSEENQHIKEFMDLDTNSDVSAVPSNKNNSFLKNISLFCQWTIAKVIAEINNPPMHNYRSKIVLELEDFLCTVDQGIDFTKYTSKIGNFNLNLQTQQGQGQQSEWHFQESLRIRMIAETNDLPFLNIVVTKVSLRDFYKKIGAKRTGETDQYISELLIVLQAMEVICDFNSIHPFAQPLCDLMEGGEESKKNWESDEEKPERIVKACDLPLLHFESKGITCYFPISNEGETNKNTVLISKIESINVTPNLQNPLQRKPLRPDVYGKAASMGILSIPGSLVEDRQYEMKIKKISAASGNWNEILTHMRNKDHNFHTNPAVEWNNPERKQSLRLTEIFKNFTLIAIYAPNIVYNNILICGETTEFNCSSDFIANLNTEQLQMLGNCLGTIKQISAEIQSVCSQKSAIIPLSHHTSHTSDATLFYSPLSRSFSSLKFVSMASLSGSCKVPEVHLDTRRLSRLNSSSQFESIDEDIEPVPRTDSGVQSMTSRPSGRIKPALYKPQKCTSILLEKVPYSNASVLPSAATTKRHLPKTISLVAGVFCFKIFDILDNETPLEEGQCGKPLMSCTISQPSFMTTQNIYDHVVNFSVYNFSIFLPNLNSSGQNVECSHLFLKPFIDTQPGETDSTGIPPALLTYRAQHTKLKMLDVDIDLSKPLIMTISKQSIEQLCSTVIIVYNSMQSLFTNSTARVICPADSMPRKSKILLMKENTLNADRLNIKCNYIALQLTNFSDYQCNFIVNDIKLNIKYLTRPEKCSIKYSLAAVYVRTKKRVALHPISLKGSIEFISEPWNRLPLTNTVLKFNVVHADISVKILRQLKKAAEDLTCIATCIQEGIKRLELFNLNRQAQTTTAINRNNLKQLKCPSVESFVAKNKSLKREEFYQDDLRAGAFQFVEVNSDAVLPLPYQIQIIKKDYGIICWRYPQPRKMCKIHIYPVPMAVSNPIHIKCRMEYFSDVHERFLHYCDFCLSETNSKDIKLPEREMCANIWRVVILQSLVSIDGECFDTSEEDDELQSISAVNIDQVLQENRMDSDFILHPKVLVGCMRVDTTFQSNSVPKFQMLISCNSMVLKLFNQQEENDELPVQLKKYNLVETSNIPNAFLELSLQNSNVYSAFFSELKYHVNVNLTCHIQYLDYGYLNMLSLLEETSVQAYFEVDKQANVVNANVVSDRVRVNFGPSVIHTLLSSKTLWEECLDEDWCHVSHVIIPKCVFLNRTMSNIAFGQTGTNERIALGPRECYLYSFRSDCHSQEITLYISDEETNTVDTSPPIRIPFKFDSDSFIQDLWMGNKCVTVKSKKLSGSQIFIMIKGQIELFSMVPHNLFCQFRHEGKISDDSNKPLEYYIDKNGRNTFYQSIDRNSNISMRLKLADLNIKARTGDIPLRTNKMLPWLVKVPLMDSNEFISLWVRVLREDIPNLQTDASCPQKILITIWPIFEISSMLSYPISMRHVSTKDELQIAGEGGRLVLDTPATHLTEHLMFFKYNVPLGKDSENNYTLRLKSLDWQKFFWYDEEKWTVENSLNMLCKPVKIKWPLDDEEELRMKRVSIPGNEIDIIYTTRPSREFSCTLNLEIAPWGFFINSTGLELRVCELVTTKEKREIYIAAHGLEMLFDLGKGFTIAIPYGASWIQSLPIYFNNEVADKNKRHYVVNEEDGGTDIAILLASDVYNFVLKLKVENDRKVLKLFPKFGVVNYTKNELVLLPFAMDHKESVQRKSVQHLDANVNVTVISPSVAWENSMGISMTHFHDINFETTQRSEDSAFVYFVALKMSEHIDAICSIPIPLGLPFNRKCFSIQNGKDSIALAVTLIEHDRVYYLAIYEDTSPAVLLSNQTYCPFMIAQTNASENSNVTSTTPEYEGKHYEWYQVVQGQSKCFYTPPEWYTRFPEVESSICNITIALYDDFSTKKTIKWSKPIRTDKTWKKYLHIPGHGDVKVIICDRHRVRRINIYYISQQMEFSVKDLRLRLSSSEPTTTGKLDSDPERRSSKINSSFSSTTNSFISESSQYLIPDVCHHFRNECDFKPDTKFRLFIKEIILSLNIDSPQRQYVKCEVLNVFADDFCVAYDDSEDQRLLDVIIPNLQIDNQLFPTGKYDFPVILCAQELYQRTDMLPDPYYLGNYYKYLTGKTPMISIKLTLYEDEFKLRSVNCRCNPVRAYIEDAYITDFLDALVECEPSNCVLISKVKTQRKQLQANEMCIPHEVKAQVLCTSEPLHLRSFCIEPISVLLSVHTSVRLYIALDHSPLSFSSYERNHLITMPIKFGQSLGMHYLSGAIFGAGWVVGSLEILGSPSGLARSVTTGLKDFVSLPVAGLFRGPWGFVVGVTQGSASLLRNITAGTVNSVSKLAASVARNLDRLSLDEEHIERTEALRRCRPQGFTEGFSQGMTGLGINMLGAVGGFAHHTLEARSTVEVFTGLSKGFLGAVTKPISGAAELVALAGQGMLQTVGFNAMPKQRAPSTCHNITYYPSGSKTWNLLPKELASDQILFYSEVTVILEQQPKRGYVFLTSTVFAIIDGKFDNILFALPVDKVEITADTTDKTLHYVNVIREREETEEDAYFTNERIMSFLRMSSIRITSDSLYDILQTHSDIRVSNVSQIQPTLEWKFYTGQNLGEHIMRYMKILNSKSYLR